MAINGGWGPHFVVYFQSQPKKDTLLGNSVGYHHIPLFLLLKSLDLLKQQPDSRVVDFRGDLEATMIVIIDKHRLSRF